MSRIVWAYAMTSNWRVFTEKLSDSLEPRLCPKIDSLYNAYRIAKLVYPELEETGNPVKLWDLHYVRVLEAQGFFDELYRKADFRKNIASKVSGENK